ncbi:RcpC/CpaB family pilus assembly protein [Streptomyces sp. NPDC020403]|uniref:RcpC/CpaB family pilus assembly protein n=1 Tax=unclassified Streptomyces TaxID=2593676 RepID=UPI0033ECE22E
MFPSVPETRPAPPAPCGIPSFPPLRVRGGGSGRLRRTLRGHRRAMAAGFALSSAVLAVSGLGGSGPGGVDPAGAEGRADVPGDVRPGPKPDRRPVRLVSAPVRIADAATVGLLRPGDRVDVIAAQEDGTGTKARLVAKDVRVTDVPGGPDGPGADRAAAFGGVADQGSGALVVLAVGRDTAAALAGAGASGRLAVAVSRAR